MQQEIAAGPVQAKDRIASIDTLRGVALLGILTVNIIGFGLVSYAYDSPIADDALAGVNFWAYVSVDLFFEGAMRAIFAMLFGAGVILFTARGDSPAATTSLADLYYKRTIPADSVRAGPMRFCCCGHGTFSTSMVSLVCFCFRCATSAPRRC